MLDRRQVPVKNNLAEWMHRGQSIRVDENLKDIHVVRFEFVDEFVSRRAIEITIKCEMNAIFGFVLKNFEVYGHRLLSFLPPGGGSIRLPQLSTVKIHDGRRKRKM